MRLGINGVSICVTTFNFPAGLVRKNLRDTKLNGIKISNFALDGIFMHMLYSLVKICEVESKSSLFCNYDQR